MKTTTRCGTVFEYDEVDSKLVGSFSWNINEGKVRQKTTDGGRYLHSLIMKNKKGIVQFKDKNPLNLTRGNLILNIGTVIREVLTTFNKIDSKISEGVTKSGYRFIFDTDKWDIITGRNWCKSTGYLGSHIDGKAIQMHRYLMGAKRGEFVDHRNHQPWDNRIENLRLCTRVQNNRNKSSTQGVWYWAERGKWIAQIMINYKRIGLGYFWTKEAAQLAYCKKAREIFGEFEPPICKEVLDNL